MCFILSTSQFELATFSVLSSPHMASSYHTGQHSVSTVSKEAAGGAAAVAEEEGFYLSNRELGVGALPFRLWEPSTDLRQRSVFNFEFNLVVSDNRDSGVGAQARSMLEGCCCLSKEC